MKKINVNIGIPAYNEGENIKTLIQIILDQKNKNYILNNIIIISDKSTDGTVSEVKKVKNSKIILIEKKIRQGKSQLLNELFKISNSDVLILLDAEIRIKDRFLFEKLLAPIINNDSVGLVGGSPIPESSNNFIQRSINTTYSPYIKIRESLNNGNNIYGCSGTLLAVSKSFYKFVSIPKESTGNDAFLYFSCITSGFKFIHVSNAKIYLKTPDNLRDHFNQNSRWVKARGNLIKRFGDLVNKEYLIPKRLFFGSLIEQFIKTPIESGFIFSINLFIKLVARFNHKTKAKWKVAKSTK